MMFEDGVCDVRGEVMLMELAPSASIHKVVDNLQAYLTHTWRKCPAIETKG